MRIVFSEEVMADKQLWPTLDRILFTVEDGWHLWEIPDPEAMEQSHWLLKGRSQLRDLFEAASRHSAWQSRGDIHFRCVIVAAQSSNDPSRLPAETARRYLSQPLVVLMENTESDGMFLDAVLDLLGCEELQRLRSCSPPAIEYDSPGGSELPKRIGKYIDDPAWTGVPRRIFVVTDSDRLTDDDDLGQLAEQVTAACEANKVPFHILQKRSIENYIPQAALEARAERTPDLREKAAAIARLDSEQRDHFPLKKGFPKGIPPKQQSLFSLSRWNEEDRAILLDEGKREFGKKIYQIFRDHRDEITSESLRECSGPQLDDGDETELDHLVTQICREL